MTCDLILSIVVRSELYFYEPVEFKLILDAESLPKGEE